MNKINWKLRLKNKPTLAALIAAVLALAYKVLDLFGVVPPVEQSALLELASAAVGILVLLGIVVDPTTPGVADSARAQGYQTPGG